MFWKNASSPGCGTITTGNPMEIGKGSNTVAPRTGSLSPLPKKKDIYGPTIDAVEWDNPKQHIHPYLVKREYSLKHEAFRDEVPVCQLRRRSEDDIEPVNDTRGLLRYPSACL